MGPVKRKSAFEQAQKCADEHHPAHAQGTIPAFALHRYILLYPMILAVDSEGPGQTVPSLSAHAPKVLFRSARLKLSVLL